MKLKLICCEVFFRMACLTASQSENTVDLEFTPLKAHTEADDLRSKIQAAIDRTEAEGGDYDAIVLGFGLCGNSVAGIKARNLKLVIPRAHDCCTIFLGSRHKFVQNFGDRLSAKWSSHGYLERTGDYFGGTELAKSYGFSREYDELVEQYGEENAQFVWETLHPKLPDQDKIYIRVEPFELFGFFEKFQQKVREEAEDGQEPKIQVLDGSIRLMSKLLNGEWDDEYLVVQPGKSIQPVYDMEQIICEGSAGE